MIFTNVACRDVTLKKHVHPNGHSAQQPVAIINLTQDVRALFKNHQNSKTCRSACMDAASIRVKDSLIPFKTSGSIESYSSTGFALFDSNIMSATELSIL